MSKLSELRVLRYGRSVDAPIKHHHRTGDEDGNGASRLDLYVQSESAEEILLDGEDELAKAQFLKGFSGYLRKVYDKTEREFLRRLMSGKEKPHEVGRALGVDWFQYMQSIQRKAYKNTKPLLKLSTLTGWSKAEAFTAHVLRRVSMLENGAELSDLLPKIADRAKARAELKDIREQHDKENKNKLSIYARFYYIRNQEKIKEAALAWKKSNSEKVKEYYRAWAKANAEKDKERHRAWKKSNPEKVKEYYRAWVKANAEKDKERKKAWAKANAEKVKEAARAWEKANPEKAKARGKAWRDSHKEELRQYKALYRARKKAEREAAKMALQAVALSELANALETGANV